MSNPHVDPARSAALRALSRAAAQTDQVAALPKKLSPSRAAEYMKCPQKFYYQTICGIETPESRAALRGTLAHHAFERIFDHPEGERTADLAVSYIAPAWQEILHPALESLEDVERDRAVRKAAASAEAVPPGSEEESTLLAETEAVVRSWFQVERVNNFTPTNLLLPDGTVLDDGREVHVSADLDGVTAHGYVDRLDRYELSGGEVCWSITDYKTSAMAPWLKKNYRPETTERIRLEAFFQLLVYAAVIWKMHDVRVGVLRLVYPATGDKHTGVQELRVTQQLIDNTLDTLERVWREINNSARERTWKAKTSKLCDWCYFQDICPAFSTEDTDVSQMLDPEDGAPNAA